MNKHLHDALNYVRDAFIRPADGLTTGILTIGACATVGALFADALVQAFYWGAETALYGAISMVGHLVHVRRELRGDQAALDGFAARHTARVEALRARLQRNT